MSPGSVLCCPFCFQPCLPEHVTEAEPEVMMTSHFKSGFSLDKILLSFIWFIDRGLSMWTVVAVVALAVLRLQFRRHYPECRMASR